MFAKYEIPYVTVDLDSVAYQQDNKGGKIRAALLDKTGSKTIPQIFVGGRFIGGATELFDSQKDGELAELLEKSSVAFNKEVDADPYSFLPGWLQER
jgi:cysteine synthase A